MKESSYAGYIDRIQETIEDIHENLDGDHSVAHLAQRCFMSKFHFQRVFQRITGESCLKLVRRLRLERAAWQLQNTRNQISTIAIDAGYNSLEAFARAFRKVYGSKASTFRESEWEEYRILSPNRVHYSPNGEIRFEPLSKDLCSVPFEVRQVEQRTVFARRHEGSPHLIGKSLRKLWSEQKVRLDQESINAMVSLAYGLRPEAAVDDIDSYVASYIDSPGLEPVTIGGGRHIVVEFEKEGEALGDFWFKIWAEVLPASGCVLRAAPCYQVIRVTEENAIRPKYRATIYIPVTED